jgi:hypothetical protein
MSTITFPITIEIPSTFWRDHHQQRGCSPTATVTKETERLTTVILDAEAWDDLLGDAKHYAHPGQYGPEYFGLVTSAKATVRRMKAATA